MRDEDGKVGEGPRLRYKLSCYSRYGEETSEIYYSDGRVLIDSDLHFITITLATA